MQVKTLIRQTKSTIYCTFLARLGPFALAILNLVAILPGLVINSPGAEAGAWNYWWELE